MGSDYIMQQEETKDATNTKKQYVPPRLLPQDHMARVTQKTSGGDDQNVGNLRKDTRPFGSGSGDLTGDNTAGNSGGEAGGLFDSPFDD